jgi:hypothetical protein
VVKAASRRKRRRKPSWLDVGFGAFGLAAEAAQVVALRGLALSRGGPAAAQEANRMVAEKVAAAFDLQAAALSGRLGREPATVTARALQRVRRKVRANRRRLQG